MSKIEDIVANYFFGLIRNKTRLQRGNTLLFMQLIIFIYKIVVLFASFVINLLIDSTNIIVNVLQIHNT